MRKTGADLVGQNSAAVQTQLFCSYDDGNAHQASQHILVRFLSLYRPFGRFSFGKRSCFTAHQIISGAAERFGKGLGS
jgi:hypothetical protein